MHNVNKLIEFVRRQHGGQLRKYTNEPYFNHLIAVAEMADGKCAFGFEIGLCHDLLEDTDCNALNLQSALILSGYNDDARWLIGQCVWDLTDQYTQIQHPDKNRKERKNLEALRLHHISLASQTVKYCDLINNTESIVKHDKKFAKTYLSEKREILQGMNKGDTVLYNKCIEVLQAAEMELYGLPYAIPIDHWFAVGTKLAFSVNLTPPSPYNNQ